MKKKRSRKQKLLDVSIIVAITLILGEISVRLFVTLPPVFEDEKTLCYRFDHKLGWFPKENSKTVYSGSVDIDVINNSEGFRDKEHTQNSEKPGIAYFGDSFVWGYDVNQDERITEIASQLLPEWDVYNFGVSGYGTDQEYLLLQDYFPKYQPKVVVLVVHSNDDLDNTTNIRYHYRKPYYELKEGILNLQGQPVTTSFNFQAHDHPTLFKSKLFQALTVVYNKLKNQDQIDGPIITNELISEFNKYVSNRGSNLLVVYTYEEGEEDKSYLSENNIEYICLPTQLKFREYGQHWTAEGHKTVGSEILGQLYRLGWIKDEDLYKG
jgi:hypothetical protein